jgi:hypothetical protein
MTTEKKVARRKLSLLALASELGNISRACRIIGYSRQQFYQIRRSYQVHGARRVWWIACQVPRDRIPTGFPRRSRRPSRITSSPILAMAV